eukprot:CAMPEP_0116561436 /NCGR_PEP_ID=MMETSP0397-20121206/11582_1 /TAXON_ID=216820 /ORGANISM="Cyclophora tenuis, Strain ECT3854" /LENGTH=209 /DNA_ID=CAMNT_0004087579 /DNA_START=74 /DNA_END=703 /DNA_ORIENTATION=-
MMILEHQQARLLARKFLDRCWSLVALGAVMIIVVESMARRPTKSGMRLRIESAATTTNVVSSSSSFDEVTPSSSSISLSSFVSTETTTKTTTTAVVEKKNDDDDDDDRFWMEGVIRPLFVELGGLVICQIVGIPAAVKLGSFLHRIRLQKLLSRFGSGIGSSIPIRFPLWRRIQRTIVRLYKNRQRLSAASDLTHLMGDEEGDNLSHHR